MFIRWRRKRVDLLFLTFPIDRSSIALMSIFQFSTYSSPQFSVTGYKIKKQKFIVWKMEEMSSILSKIKPLCSKMNEIGKL